MAPTNDRWIRIVVASSQPQGSGDRQEQVRLPLQADIVDLLDVLKSSSSPLYEDVRKYVLRLSGDVLAFGRERPALVDLRDQLARGGPVVIAETSLDEVS